MKRNKSAEFITKIRGWIFIIRGVTDTQHEHLFQSIFFSLILIMLLSFDVLAKAPQPFIDKHSGQPLYPKFAEVESAVARIKNSTSCTGFFVSRDGYFVTALHCAYKFLMNREVKPLLLMSMSDSIVKADVWTTEGQTSELLFEAIVGFRDFTINQSSFLPTSVFIGSGFIASKPYYDSSSVLTLSSDNHQYISKFNEDYIILKFPVTESVKCIKLADKLVDGEPLWSFGYMKDLSSNQSVFSVSTGPAALKPSNLYSLGTLSGIPIEEYIFDWSKMAVGGFPIGSGMCGGPIVNQNGEAVGINSISYAGFSIFPLMTYIKSNVTKALGNEKMQSIFNCDY